jgi:hypothetical protein
VLKASVPSPALQINNVTKWNIEIMLGVT